MPPLRILTSIVDEHFLELDILWERREASLHDPELTAADLAALEQRAQRHLEGLLLAPEYALDLARRALAANERGAATAAGFVMMDLGDPALAEELVRTLATATPEIAHGIRIALRHRDIGKQEPLLRELTASTIPHVVACSCDILSFHHRDHVPSVRELLTDADEETRTLAITALGRWAGPWTVDDLRAQLSIAVAPAAHRAALETSAVVALPELLDTCREVGTRDSDPSLEALVFLGVIGDAAEIPILQRALARPDLAPAAVAALGALGAPEGVPIILEALANPLLAHPAAVAFLRITGAENVQGEPVPPPAELDEDAAAFWDEYVPADPVLARRWWEANGSRFAADTRWNAGLAADAATTDALPLALAGDLTLRTCYRASPSAAEAPTSSNVSIEKPRSSR